MRSSQKLTAHDIILYVPLLALTVILGLDIFYKIKKEAAEPSRIMMSECLDSGERWDDCRAWVGAELERMQNGDDDE